MNEGTFNEGVGAKIGVSQRNTLEEERERLHDPIKDFRKRVDALITEASRSGTIASSHYDVERVREQVCTKLIEAKMWAGKMLEALGNPFPKELADKAN